MREEKVLINNLEINYKIAGEGEPFLILHGWGSNSERWQEVGKLFAKNGFKVIIPDLPGFGKTSALSQIWGIQEYAGFVGAFAKNLNLSKFFLMGSSFGGQIALLFAANNPEQLQKLILVSAAGVRHELTKKEKALSLLAKFFNIFISFIPSENAQNFIRRAGYILLGRSMDYAKTKRFMRKILVKIIRQDLSHIFHKITLSTLILWGDKDNITPLADAHLMKKEIPNSSLLIFPGVGHNIRHEASSKLVEAVLSFLKN